MKKGGGRGDCSIFLYTHGSATDGDREVGNEAVTGLFF